METTPALLAQLVFDGQADRHSPVRPPAGGIEGIPNATRRGWEGLRRGNRDPKREKTAFGNPTPWLPWVGQAQGPAPTGPEPWQPLEQSLGTLHCEALTTELHRRLRRMGSLDASAVDVQELCTRVEGLCQWRWPNPLIAARFFWTAGWLNELVDRSKSALDFYDAFLLMPSRENHLRLLALNNRGVLRIRMGRLDGVQDLAHAALGERPEDQKARTEEGKKERGEFRPSYIPTFLPSSPLAGLPAACFNLLNLINASFSAADLLRAVDEELMGFFCRLPPDLRASWLEGSSCGGGGESRPFGVPPVGAGPRACPGEGDHGGAPLRGKDQSDPRKGPPNAGSCAWGPERGTPNGRHEPQPPYAGRSVRADPSRSDL